MSSNLKVDTHDWQAGGIATTGRGPILDIVPTDIHERCPVFLGSKDDVNDLLKFYEQDKA